MTETVESYLKPWRERLSSSYVKEDLTPGDICSLFREKH